MKQPREGIVVGVIALGCVVSIALFGRIPVFPIAVASVLPATAAAVYVILRTVARRSVPQHLRGPILVIARYAVVFIISLHVLVVSNLAGVAWARTLGPRAVVVLLGCIFIAAGNLLPRTRPNHAIGLCTQRMLADPRLWSRMHRAAGYAAVCLGCVVVAAGLLLSGQAIGLVASGAAILAVTTLSFTYWRLMHD